MIPGRRRAVEAAALAAVAAVALILPVRHWRAPIDWTPDGLFYQAKLLQVRGATEREALDEVFGGPLAAEIRRQEAGRPLGEREITSPRWVEFNRRFYERRWLVPALAAAAEPWLGERSLQAVSLAGYVVAGLLLYALLRLRFGPAPSAAATIVCLLLPPLKAWSLHPITDSWGLGLEIASLLTAVLTLRRGPTWLPAWMASMAALSFAREIGFLLLAALTAFAALSRSRRAAWLAVTGAAASAPSLAFGAPLRELLAYVYNGARLPPDSSWSWVLSHYPEALGRMLEDEAAYVRDHPVTALVFAAGLLLLFALSRGGVFLRLHRLATVATVVYLLLFANFSLFRYELALVPMVGAGLALAAAALLARLAGSRRSVESA